MGVLEDMTGRNGNTEEPVVVYSDLAERFVCEYCGQEYISRGKRDPGNICRKCEQEQKERERPFVGGPLDGKVIRNV